MRMTRYHVVLLGGFLLIAFASVAFTQPGGRTKGGKGGKGFVDPAAMWDQLSGGKDSININEIQFPPQMAMFADRIKDRLASFLQSKGITNGVITRELYLESAEQQRQEMQARKGGKGGKGGRGPTPPGAAPGTPGDATTGKDGKGDTRGSRGVLPGEDDPPSVVEEKRPIVYRANQLPKELPAWFAERDRDKDGQVGLYEWKNAGMPVSEFLAMDKNEDGFVTVEEVLRIQRATAKKEEAKAAAAGGSQGAIAAAGGPGERMGPGRGGMPGFGGRGGPGGGMPGFGGRGGPGGGMPGFGGRGGPGGGMPGMGGRGGPGGPGGMPGMGGRGGPGGGMPRFNRGPGGQGDDEARQPRTKGKSKGGRGGRPGGG